MGFATAMIAIQPHPVIPRSLKSTLCLAGLASALLLSGCQTVRDARAVQRNEKPAIGEYTPAAADFGLTADGRTLTLDELQQIALECHPSIRAALHNAEAAYLNVKAVKANYLPTLGASVSHSRATNNVNAHSTGFSHTGTWNGGLSLDLLIYDFGRTDAQERQLLEKYKAALLDLRNARNNVVFNVRAAFFALHRAVELDAVALQTIRQYEQHRDQVKARKEVGAGTNYDLTKAEVDVYNAILSQHKTNNDISLAWAQLINALGFAEKVTFKLDKTTLRDYTLDVAKLMELARLGNPTLASLKTAEQAASHGVDAAIAELYPSLNLSLSGNVSGRSTGFPLLWNLSGAAAIAQNLFNGGRNMIAIQQAAIALQNTRAALAEFEQTLFQQLTDAALNASLAQRQLKTAIEVEKQAKEYYDIVNTQYSVGKSSALERTDAQVALSGAQANVVSARFDYQNALASIAQLIGDFPEPPADNTPKPTID